MYWLHWFAPQLVLKQFELRGRPARRGAPVLEVAGRRSGLGALLLSLFGLDPTVTVTVTASEVRMRSSGMSGESLDVLPLRQIASVHVSTTNPVVLLIFAGVVGLLGLAGAAASQALEPLLGAVGLALILVVAYFLVGRKFSIAFVSAAGSAVAVGFKPRTVQGQVVDMERLLAAADVVRELIGRAGASAAAPGGEEVVSGELLPPEDAEPLPIEVVEPGDLSFAPPSATASEPQPANPFVFDQPAAAHAPPLPVEHEAREAFQRAASLYRKGKKKEAIAAWQEITARYPGTHAAAAAARNLDKLRAQG